MEHFNNGLTPAGLPADFKNKTKKHLREIKIFMNGLIKLLFVYSGLNVDS